MFLHIHDQMTISDVQDRFNECFPFLSIRFYSMPHRKFQPTDRRYEYAGDRFIHEVRKDGKNGVLEIKSWYTASKVEKELKELFGLNAQVYRTNSKGEPIQTSVSDELTLEKLSEFAYDPIMNA
jgi:hypothetical protein